jgi:hypothetical protein
MANTALQLGQAGITTGVTTLYTVPGATKTVVKSIDLCNTTTSPIKVRIFLVPSGGSALAANALVYDKTIPANDVLGWEGEQVLAAAGFIQIQASLAGVTIVASGVEMT